MKQTRSNKISAIDARSKRSARWVIHGFAIAALVVVLAAYARPDLVAQLANLMWLCFK
jgi:hypothetical protein